MASEPVKALTSCGISEAYAEELATRHKSEHERMIKDPVGFIEDHWYADINLGSLTNVYNLSEMRDAFLKLHIKPDLAEAITKRSGHDEQQFGHRDAVEWAVIAISGQHQRASKA
ncbi:uncharacterized protein LAESUDRAFT_731462 [Laetiporus sulphureus 93-53]|uniref:Uncharacterized protein n=1 Tax=Laetiporus sulphureus 93-53 TaxID=1314785 RepID=A0A165BKT3_9APHY|nr:uncharacterized protein LAESUDRAFT_731462 [Laetiporus sulphureus 93-53]KZT01235.1 hypothetical protein LAESUDRAFT_731462 [Laetiporus sulphureus 93-53]